MSQQIFSNKSMASDESCLADFSMCILGTQTNFQGM